MKKLLAPLAIAALLFSMGGTSLAQSNVSTVESVVIAGQGKMDKMDKKAPPKKGATKKGMTKKGAAKKGATKKGATKKGATKKGMTKGKMSKGKMDKMDKMKK